MPSFTLIRPIFSEKAQNQAAKDAYTFEVAKTATKLEIKKAVEAQFEVKVENIRTQIVKPEVKRQGRFFGKTKAFKKAIVKLREGSIDLWVPPEKEIKKSKIKNKK